ncbi:MAG TPA: NAD-dependent epimerase/dehydratase family protein, partial [Halothiobacillaceae bacterium]|nr:NAD-dependent epimerase/dehydratase family protein [Halothiobacillaceae bacterium]
MRVFVTGASGFIGRRLLPVLAAAEHEVTALLLPGDETRLDAASRIVPGDITQAESLAGLPAEHDAIVHLAGAVGYGQTFARCTQLNVVGTRN